MYILRSNGYVQDVIYYQNQTLFKKKPKMSFNVSILNFVIQICERVMF